MDTLWTPQTFDMLGALTGVLLLIVGVAWLFKRSQLGQTRSQKHLKVVSILPLSPKERVVLVQAGEEQVLMGISAAGIQHLHTLRDPVQVDVPTDEDRISPPATGFAAILRSNLTGRPS